MTFHSIEFFAFLALVWLLHLFVRDRHRWMLLLLASFVFYSSLGLFRLLAVFVCISLFSCYYGIMIAEANDPAEKRSLLWRGIGLNIMVLISLKYLPFILDNLNSVLDHFHSGIELPSPDIISTIGISFLVFQSISYLCDIYFEAAPAEKNYGMVLLYFLFFPKVLQGPIERAGDLIGQFKGAYVFNYDNMRFGLMLIMFGLFKKVVLADRVELYIDAVYSSCHSYGGMSLLMATYAFYLYLYFDFSGYTDIALGSARLFNIHLKPNFKSPYFATSIADFWRRWHISFSSWILDYIFKPLQMLWRRQVVWGTLAAMMVTFLVSGIWHGAEWGFVIWGVLHGIFMSVYVLWEVIGRRKKKKTHAQNYQQITRVWKIFLTFNLVCMAWVFFRADSTDDAVYIINRIVSDLLSVNVPGEAGKTHAAFPKISRADILVFIGGTLFVFVWENWRRFRLLEFPAAVRWAIYTLMMMLIIWFGKFGNSEYAYFRF